MKNAKKLGALALALVMAFSLIAATPALAAKRKTPAKVQKITLNKRTLTLAAGKMSTLKATVKPKSRQNALKWKSSKTSVVTVSKSGKLTAKKAGTATVTAYIGKVKVTCKVTVKAKPTTAPNPTDTPTPTGTPQPTPTNTPELTPTTPAPTDEPPPYETIAFGGIIWRVLAREDGKTLVISDEILERRAYHRTDDYATWETSEIRAWLNSMFYDHFSEVDKARIIETPLVNNDNPWWDTNGGNNTVDKVFLLSLEELVRYFGDSGQLANGNPNSSWFIDDEYNSNRIARRNGTAWWWWLRSPGSILNYAALVTAGGGGYLDGCPVDDGSGGVRPALWLNL